MSLLRTRAICSDFVSLCLLRVRRATVDASQNAGDPGLLRCSYTDGRVKAERVRHSRDAVAQVPHVQCKEPSVRARDRLPQRYRLILVVRIDKKTNRPGKR